MHKAFIGSSSHASISKYGSEREIADYTVSIHALFVCYFRSLIQVVVGILMALTFDVTSLASFLVLIGFHYCNYVLICNFVLLPDLIFALV